MFKSTLFFIMTFMMCFSAGARSFVRTHEDFVHLSDYQKNQHIIKVMELVVELESKYKFETKKYGYSQSRFERYQKALEKISSILFIDNAYAESAFPASVRHSDWNGLGQRFGEILNREGGKNRCIFAGWISETTVGADGKTYCNHPTRSERAARGYPNPEASSGCARDNTNHIQCNPLIFGYKNSQSKSLFCVSTDSRAKNSSYHCMEKALGIVTEPNSDSHSDRLASLRSNLSSNPAVFTQVQEFVYRTCVCDSTHENFNQAYQNAIRPHRTCYGLMNMIGETISCENPEFPLEDHSIFENLQTYMRNKSISESTADGHYQQFLTELRKDTTEYRRICQLPAEEPEVVNYACESFTCPDGEGPCDYVVKVQDGPATAVTFSERPTEKPPEAGGAFTINFKVGGQAGTASCEAPVNTPVEYECVATCTLPAATPAAASGDAAAATGGNPNPNPTPATTCDISSVIDKASREAVDFEKVSNPETLPTAAGTSTLSFVVKINNEDKTLACNVTTTQTTPPADTDTDTNTDDTNTDDGANADLEVTITSKGAEAYDIKAKPINAEGWAFSWEVVKPEGKEVEEDWTQTAAAENSGIAGLATNGSETTTTTQTAPGEESISQKRYDFNYQVFGVLKKEGKTDIRKPVTVDKKSAAADADAGRNRFPNVNPNLVPGGQAPMRGTSDTSAIGIR